MREPRAMNQRERRARESSARADVHPFFGLTSKTSLPAASCPNSEWDVSLPEMVKRSWPVWACLISVSTETSMRGVVSTHVAQIANN